MKTFIDLFCGIGGFRLALEGAGLQCVFSSEIDKHAAKMYEINFNEAPQGDITQIKADAIPQHDILCGGFPCQSFSLSGNKQGFNDTRGDLFFDIVRIAKHHKPKVLLLENVKNILTIEGGAVLATITQELNAIGYDVNYSLLNASDYGIPQARHRVYFVCLLRGSNLHYRTPAPDIMQPIICLQDVLIDNDECQHLIIKRNDIKINWRKLNQPKKNAIKKLGHVANNNQGSYILDSTGHAQTLCAKKGAYDQGLYAVDNPPKQSRTIRAGTIGKGNQDEVIYNPKGHAISLGACNKLGSQGFYLIDVETKQPNPVQIGIIGNGSQGDRIYGTNGHAVSQQANTGGFGGKTGLYLVDTKEKQSKPIRIGQKGKGQSQRIHSAKGHATTQMGNLKGGAATGGLYLVDKIIRKLHIKECKAIMGFPQSHEVSKGGQGYKQLGNAVIPKMIELVYRGIK